MSLKIAISGAAGRMGLRLVACAHEDSSLVVVDAIESESNPGVGNDSGVLAGVAANQILLSPTFSGDCDVVIDFSTPEGAQKAIDFCEQHACPLVMATTGLEEAELVSIRKLSKSVPVVWAPSMSLAVNLMMKVSEFVGRSLKKVGTPVDVEILERHHRFKVDAPSGTALKFGDIVSEAMGLKQQSHGREGVTGVRSADEIGYHAVRAGDDPGQHTILFGMQGEKIELHVAASNRDCYALGALAAAKFVVTQEPGLYSMFDVLGLSDGEV